MRYQRPLRWIEMLDDLTSVEFLLRVTIAGRDFYFSTRPRVLYDESGEPIQFDGGLEAEWTDALNLFNDSPTLLSIPLELYFSVDIAQLVADGHDLWRGTGELSLWIEGRPYEDRVILIDGSMSEPQYGAKGEPVKFSLESNGFQDSALTHTQTQKVTLETWPEPDEDSIDQYYPIVFGTPGVYTLPSGTPAATYGSPAPICKGTFPSPLAIVAGHEVEATEVTAYNVSQSPIVSAVKTVTTQTDQLGNLVSIIDIGSGLSWAPGDEIWISWDVNGGGAYNDTRTANLTGGGEVARYFLRLSTLKTDVGTWRAVGTYLDQNFKFSGYINDAVGPWNWLRDNLIELLPLSIYTTSEGVSASLWRRESTKADAVGTITTGGGVARVDLVQYENQQIINDFRISYALKGGDQTLRTAGVIGDREPTADEVGIFSTEYSRASFLRYGTKAQTFESDIIYEDATAANVLQWKHRASALPYRVISYDVPIRLGFLRRGDLVLLTDPEIYLSEYLAFVRDIQWTDGKPRLVLVLVDDPPREDRLN